MNSMSGIDLSELTEAQRKMCVKLLAVNNVQFKQSNDSYVATLRIPTNQINNYLNSQKSNHNKQVEPKSAKKIINNKQNQRHKLGREKTITNQKTVAKSKQKEKINTKKVNIKKQPNKTNLSKKSLFKTVKLPVITKLQALYPHVQIYVYPKRLNLAIVQQQVQEIYQNFWQLIKQGSSGEENFHKCFIQTLCFYNTVNNKSKNDQNIVNMLESINHYQHKETGVRMLNNFLTQEYSKQMLSYFLVIRALIEQLVGEKIMVVRPKTKGLNQVGLSSANLSTTSLNKKLKWNPFQKQLSEFIVQNFLRVVLPNNNSTNIDSIFEKLTQFMYYCETKKGNFIFFYDLMDFMLRRFNQQCQDITVTNLQLSYSNNDSILNDIVAQSGEKYSSDRQLQTNFELSLIPQSQLNFDHLQAEKQSSFRNDKILAEKATQSVKQICKKMQISNEDQQLIMSKVLQCIQSIVQMDKIKWVQALDIQGTQQQLNFIQGIQLQYKNTCEEGLKLTVANAMVKRMFTGPGFIKLFSKFIVF